MNPTYDFTGQVAVITGASSKIGLAAASAFAISGAAVVLADIDQTALDTKADQLAAAGHQVVGIRCGVADEVQVEAMINQTSPPSANLDMAFNNAGIAGPSGDLANEAISDFDSARRQPPRRLDLPQARAPPDARPRLRRHRDTSSIGGLVGLPGRASYHATKHCVIGFTKSTAVEYASLGIRINAICTGVIHTPMAADMIENHPEAMQEFLRDQPIGRPGTAEEVAAAALWLCSPAASLVVGVALPVDGGLTAH